MTRTKIDRMPAVLTGLLLAGGAMFASPAAAQLPSASASTLGLAGNNTASVRGFGAIGVNPAGLARPRSNFGLAILTPQLRLGLDPITTGDIADFGDRVVPDATKNEWLTRVIEAGGEAGSVGVDATAIALTIGRLGFQVSTIGAAEVNLPPGLVEAALFGNAGRTGEATDLSLAEGSLDVFATSTVGVSYGFDVSPLLSLGVTGKYTLGHAVLLGRSEAGMLEADPIRATADAPILSSCVDEIGCTQDFVNGGSGVGLDVGAIADVGPVTVAASIQNLFNTFSWDEEKLGYRTGTLLFEQSEFTSDYDERPFDAAPDDLQQVVADYKFKPSFRLGAALDVTPMLTLTGDIHGRFSDEAIDIGPSYHTGVGAELRLGVVELRTGVSKISDAIQIAGGGSLILGPVNLSGAIGLQRGDLNDSLLSQITLSFGDR